MDGRKPNLAVLKWRARTGSTIYSNLMGRFPVESYTGMNYILVVYVYKLNAPLMRAIKSRQDADIVAAFQSVCEELIAYGHKPALHVLDNKCSRAVKTYIRSNKTDIQLVEPHNHRVNAAEVGASSFRSGGATDLRAALGAGSGEIVKKRGPWESDTHEIYTRPVLSEWALGH